MNHERITPQQHFDASKIELPIDPGELTVVTVNMIKGLAQDSEEFTPQARALFLNILPEIPYDELDSHVLRDSYLESVSRQDEQSDPGGPIHDLLKAGVILVPHFPDEKKTYSVVMTAWGEVAQKVKHKPDWAAVRETVLDLEESLPYNNRMGASLREVKDMYVSGLAESTMGSRLQVSSGTISNRVAELKKFGLVSEKKSREMRFVWQY